jgi:hypothetical protein
MTDFHTHFLHCDLIHNGDVASQNQTQQLGLMDKHLQSMFFLYGGLPSWFSDLQTAHEVCARWCSRCAVCLIKGTENPKKMNLRPVKMGSTRGQDMMDGGAIL